MILEPAKTLQEIRKFTEPTPLNGNKLNTFYVSTDVARNQALPPSTLLSDYLYNTQASLHLLFAGHPGSGKSTELNYLRQNSSDEFWFVRLSAQQDLDIMALTVQDLMLALIHRLYIQGQQENLIHDPRVTTPLHQWLMDILTECDVPYHLSPIDETDQATTLSQILTLMTYIKDAFNHSIESAQLLRQQLAPKTAVLRNFCNAAIHEITTHLEQQTPSRRLLILVEDTDKLDVKIARQLFVENAGLLSDLKASIIYTFPLFLVHSSDSKRLEDYFLLLMLPMIKTYTESGEPFEQGWDILRQVVFSRIQKHLIEQEAVDLAIQKTGGILRDLLRVLQNASRVAHFNSANQITVDAVRSSLNRLKLNYQSSIYGRGATDTEDLYQKLIEIVRANGNPVPKDDALQQLLYTQAVIEYNGNGWYSVHPLMYEALLEMGKL